MRSRSLLQFARFKPLTAWSLSSALLGTGLAAYLSGWNIIAPVPMVLAIICVILMQYVAHPMNDIMDFELDRQAPIASTGRFKPIVVGDITIEEAKRLSLVIVLIILAIMTYLIALQPVLIVPAAYGLAALVGYNHSSLRLAYKPGAELYLGMPINAISVLVISFIGSGQVNEVSLIVGLAFGFSSNSFFVSMMSMDFPTDLANGKRTTVVALPRLRWCTYYPLVGLLIASAGTVLMLPVIGLLPSALFALLSISVFLALSWYGAKADDLRLQYLDGQIRDPEGRSGYLRLRQLYLSVVYAVSLSALFIIWGGW